MPMSVLAHLVAVYRGVSEGSAKLSHLLTNQQAIASLQRDIMTTLADLTAKMDNVNAEIVKIAAAQESQATSQQTIVDTTANIAADVQRLKDLIGSGTPGLTAEEAAVADQLLAGVLANASAVSAKAQASAAALTDNAANLQALADSTPETASGDPV